MAAASLKCTSRVALGMARSARFMKISHSARASPTRRRGIWGEKYTRRSVDVSVPPPRCSYRVCAGNSRTFSAGSMSMDVVRTRSWWMRSGMRPSASRTYAGSGSVSRKLPPAWYKTSRRPSCAASIIPTAVMPPIVGGRKPQIFPNRSAFSSSTGNPRPYAPGWAPISEPPWTPLCPRIGMRPHFSRPTFPRDACLAFELLPGLRHEQHAQRIEAGRVLLDERVVDPVVLEHVLEDARDEGDVASRVDREEFVGEVRAEEGAAGDRRHPVPLEARLPHRVHDRDLRPELLRVVQVFHRHGLVVRDVGAEEDDEVGADPVRV